EDRRTSTGHGHRHPRGRERPAGLAASPTATL
ncbi:MAG: hypothetical protein AVDCRST_MAG01-01-4941, partial [uncultured Rubrobacteraceae bacterium]